MMPRPPFISVQRWCALCLLALSLSVGGSAKAQSYEPPRPEARDTHLEESRLIATEGSEQDVFYNRPSRTIVFGAGGLIFGFFASAILIEAVDPMDINELLLGAAIGSVVGATICGSYGYRSWKGRGPRRSLSLSPYRHDDASGLMFSGQF